MPDVVWTASNNSNESQRLILDGSNSGFLSNAQQIIDRVEGSDLYQATRDLPLALWQWIIDNSNHDYPYTGAAWLHEPLVYLNSIGRGFCDDVANVMSAVLQYAGIPARVWGLSGHVICEAYIDGEWRIYDPDLKVLFVKQDGTLAGVDYITSHPQEDWLANLRQSEFSSLVTNSHAAFAYGPTVLNNIYLTVQDNSIFNVLTTFELQSADWSLPAGASALIRTATGLDVPLLQGGVIKDPLVFEVTLEASTSGTISFPLIPLDIAGTGTVVFRGNTYQIGNPALMQAIRSAQLNSNELNIGLQVVAGNEDVLLTFLVNRHFFEDASRPSHQFSGDLASNFVLSDAGEDVWLQNGKGNIDGGSGNDMIGLVSSGLNGSAGSQVRGGGGDDHLVLDGIQAYAADYVLLAGESGNDLIEAGLGAGQYVGSVKIEGGDGADAILLGHIQGSRFGLGYVDGGAGGDIIRVSPTLGGLGIWSNSRFLLLGGEGYDSFEIGGLVVNVLGNENGVQIDGGAGFDTLFWSGLYNLTVGGAQNPGVGLYNGYRSDLVVHGIEHIDLSISTLSDVTFVFSAEDVGKITQGSDFDRSTLGLGLTGTGNMLFVETGAAGTIALGGWSAVGTAILDGQQYNIYSSGQSYLGVSLDPDQTIIGTSGSDLLQGGNGNDAISGGAGSDVLRGGSGNDVISLVSSGLNGSAGSQVRGGGGNDHLVLDGTQAYSADYVLLAGGSGNDLIEAGLGAGQYVGSVKIEGGDDADAILLGHIQGSRFGLGYVDGGAGGDIIRVSPTLGGMGIWSNSRFLLLGGRGYDSFEIGGLVVNVLGNENGVQIDGGAGFDTLFWSGLYNLTVGGAQNPGIGLYNGYRSDLVVHDIEHIDLSISTLSDVTFVFSAEDVGKITQGSDFDRSTLGLGLTGTGGTLLVDTASTGTVDLQGWSTVGVATVAGQQYDIYSSGQRYLGVSFDQAITGTSGGDVLRGGSGHDTISGKAGADTIDGGLGNDVISLVSSGLNGSAGSQVRGGGGNDHLVLDGTQAYSADYVLLAGGSGNDLIEAGLGAGQYVGSVKIEGGDDADAILLGHIQGSRFGLGYVDGGAGGDIIRVSPTLGGMGIWSNSRFLLLGGRGYDSFEIGGLVVNVLGNENGVQIDGGAGFDTLFWSGLYNLTVGGAQNPGIGLYNGYRSDLVVHDIEHIDLSISTLSDVTFVFSAEDVGKITQGSDFDRSTLGLGLTGTGGTLLVDTASTGTVDLQGWSTVGVATVAGQQYDIYSSGQRYLGVSFDQAITGTSGGDVLRGGSGHDTISGKAGADTIDGGLGNDVIVGGAGADQLSGGTGADVFRFQAIEDSTGAASDVVLDLNLLEGDLIDLHLVDADVSTDGVEAFSWIGQDNFSGHATELRYFESGATTYVEGDTDGNGIADFGFALTGLIDLQQAAFIL